MSFLSEKSDLESLKETRVPVQGSKVNEIDGYPPG